METIFNQTTIVTSPFNEQMLLEGLKKQLSSTIFKERIQGEKEGWEVTFTIALLSPEDNAEAEEDLHL